MAIPSSSVTTISWTFSITFFILGILNAYFVHIVPGLFYGILACMYFPPVQPFIKKVLRFSVPPSVKVIAGFVVLWGTFAVGDLMEMFEAWYLR